MEQSSKGRPTKDAKAKGKKTPTPKPKVPKKSKKVCEDGTCKTFLNDLTAKLKMKWLKQEGEKMVVDIIQSIINKLSSALPVTVTRRAIERKTSPPQIERLQTLAPELLPKDQVVVSPPIITQLVIADDDQDGDARGFKVPKMPLTNSEDLKIPIKSQKKPSMHDMAINTGADHDAASEIKKHVGTLKKISLIAEEFNQKTAKNLKEIVDSVQEDLIKKLEEIQAEQKEKDQKKYEEMMQVDEEVLG